MAHYGVVASVLFGGWRQIRTASGSRVPMRCAGHCQVYLPFGMPQRDLPHHATPSHAAVAAPTVWKSPDASGRTMVSGKKDKTFRNKQSKFVMKLPCVTRFLDAALTGFSFYVINYSQTKYTIMIKAFVEGTADSNRIPNVCCRLHHVPSSFRRSYRRFGGLGNLVAFATAAGRLKDIMENCKKK